MKVLHVSASDQLGGAAKAAFRIHRALAEHRVVSKMYVDHQLTSETGVFSSLNECSPLISRCKQYLGRLPFFLDDKSAPYGSCALFSSRAKVSKINGTECDVVNLHWIQAEMLSVEDIALIKKPIIWTLHDMWPILGCRHYEMDSNWLKSKRDQLSVKSSFDWDNWTWFRKNKTWNMPLGLICPSNWMAERASKSELARNACIQVVPNVIDTGKWVPAKKSVLRNQLGLSQTRPLVCFVAAGGIADPRKGFDILLESIRLVAMDFESLSILIIGGKDEKLSRSIPANVKATFTGPIADEQLLNQYFASSDVVVIPSRQDNLPNIGLESLASGVPVVAFDIGGMRDIVDHKTNGFLVENFDSSSLAEGISWVLHNATEFRLRARAREVAINRFSIDVVVPKYLKAIEAFLQFSQRA